MSHIQQIFNTDSKYITIQSLLYSEITLCIFLA